MNDVRLRPVRQSHDLQLSPANNLCPDEPSQANIQVAALSFEVSLDRNANVFGGYQGGGVGTPLLELLAKGAKSGLFSASVTAGLLPGNEEPSPGTLRGFIEGTALNTSVGVYAGLGRTTSLSSGLVAKEAGFMTQQVTTSFMTTEHWFSLPIRW